MNPDERSPDPLLAPERLQAFVRTYFDRGDRYLKILEKHPAPIYLQESAVLRASAARMKRAFQQRLPEVGFYFAVKSNNHPRMAGILIEEGFGLDVSSGQELEMALSLGAQDIVFSGPGKTGAELCLAVAHADRVVLLLDSFGELERLAPLAASMKTTIRCGVRLTVNPTGLWRKFGIPLHDLPAFMDAARRHSRVALCGLQFHSSWNLSPAPQIAFIGKLGSALAAMPAAARAQIEFIDIGGGYWPEQGEWLQAAGTDQGKRRQALGRPTEGHDVHYHLPATSIDGFAEALGDAVRTHLLSIAACRICLEPGRWICNDAVHLLLSVVDKKAPDLVITDAGTNTIGWERFETDYFPVLNLTRPSLEEKPCHILGSLCTPHDVWGYTYFGTDIQPGDILMIPTQGAYTYSLRQTFIKPLPCVITI
ncbi:diaminopimelate decarboxylase [Desulfosarcina alkanivorans]|uniref:Diaminopimelate decarboxylase n=2 Tax=Desulfosarcina alkanivorans TaxID=571177 RepID=A0A5K7YTM4_9BACT|nr:diaminopimelate decarboxylase [Desulfosarcina alkanivorans]